MFLQRLHADRGVVGQAGVLWELQEIAWWLCGLQALQPQMDQAHRGCIESQLNACWRGVSTDLGKDVARHRSKRSTVHLGAFLGQLVMGERELCLGVFEDLQQLQRLTVALTDGTQ